MPMIARDLMTAEASTVTPEATIADVWELMREADIRHVPIVQEGALVGMLSDRDLARMDFMRVLNVEGVDALHRALTTPVAKIMSSDVIVVEPDSEVAEVIDLLLENRIGAVPVIDGGTREVVGIISYVDVLRALRDRLEED
jgi:acetoin utilization protein AcuB